MTLDPARSAIRGAVRRPLRALDPGATVVVACSGGADSLALLAATVFEARRSRGPDGSAALRVVGLTVDHGLQEDSARHADRVVAQMADLGADETATATVRVEATGLGPEAAAREARCTALRQFAASTGAACVLLGHTRDDQAETVLLGLARGSGGRSLAGMRPAFEVFVRPLLEITRAETEAACAAEGIDWWQDPHNTDPRFLRSRVRRDVMPVLEAQLGPGVAASLARTAESLRADTEMLDEIAEAEFATLWRSGFEVGDLLTRPAAIRTRLLRLGALDSGALAGDLTRDHVLAMDWLVTQADGVRRSLDLPGPVQVTADRRRLEFRDRS